MKKFEKAEMQIIKFESEDIIVTSAGGCGVDLNDGGGSITIPTCPIDEGEDAGDAW